MLVTGGTGFVGRHLCSRLLAQGCEVTVWRHRSGLPQALRGAADVVRLEDIPADARIDAVVNLAGARILGPPWTASRRRVLLDSRIGTTLALGMWMRKRAQRPEVLVSASAVGYYGVRGRDPVEESAASQPVFQSELCRRWEAAAAGVSELGVRSVMLRFGVVLGADGGALPAFARPARLGLAAVLGNGEQGFPWIHVDDAVDIILRAIADRALGGAVNAVAPQSISQREFQQTLCGVLGRPLWLRIPAWPLRLMLGEMSQLLVDGQYVQPARALAAGHVFRHPDLRAALTDLLQRR